MSNLIITRPPQFLDPWFTEIEQVWDEVETSVNDNDTRISSLEIAIISDVVTSISKSGDPQVQGDATFTGTGAVVLTQAGQNIAIGVDVSAIDHGSLLPASLLDDDHTQYILVAGTRAFSGNQSFGNFQATSFRVENVAIVPGAGNQGRLIFDVPNLALKVDDGTSFKNVGVTDHGLLDAPSLLDDDHTQYLLTDGTRAVTGDFIVNGKYINEASEPLTLESQEADGASAVAFVMDTAVALNTAGALLLSVRNNGAEVFSIDKDGFMTGGLSSKTSLYALIDIDNDSITEEFTIETNTPTPGGGTVLFRINESGEAVLPVAGGLRIGTPGTPSDMLDVDGNADISGNLDVGGNIIPVGTVDGRDIAADGLLLDGHLNGAASKHDGTEIDYERVDGSKKNIQAGSDDVEAALTDLDDAIGALDPTPTNYSAVDAGIVADHLAGIDTKLGLESLWNRAGSVLSPENTGDDVDLGTGDLTATDVTILGSLIGGSSPFNIQSKETDGASAIAFELNTQNALSNATAKLLSIKNNNVEKCYISKDGDVSSEGTVSANSIQSKISPVYNVLEWGLVADYSWGGAYTDNASALDTLIAAIVASGTGGTIYFPPGDYGFDSSIDFGSIPAGVKIVGESGWGGFVWLAFENTASNGFENLQSATDIENIAIYGSSVAATFKAFHIDTSAHRVTISNCVVNAVPYGIYAESGANLLYFNNLDFSAGVTIAGIYLNACTDIYITESYINNTLDAIVASSCNNLSIDNLYLRTISGKGIDANNVTNFQIYNLNCDAIIGDDIELTGISDCLLVGYNSSKSGIAGIDGRDLMTIITKQDAYLNTGASLISGASPFSMKSRETDGANAIAYEFDTTNTLSNATAKLLSLKNNTVEKFYIDKDGTLRSPLNSTLSFKSGELDGAAAIGHEFDTVTSFITAGAHLLSVRNNTVEKWYVDPKGRASGDLQVITVEPSEGNAGIQNAINAASGGGIVQLKEGTYHITGGMSFGNGNNNITLQGVGDATILEHDGVAIGNIFFLSGLATGIIAMNNFSEGATSMFTTTPAQAAAVLEGNRIWAYGADSDGNEDLEINEAAADGNGTTGEIQLKNPIKRTLTTINMFYIKNGVGHKLRNFKITTLAPLATAYIRMTSCADSLIENITIDGWDGGATYGSLRMEGRGIRNTIKGCKIKNATNKGLSIEDQAELKVIENVLENVLHTPLTNLGGIDLGNRCVDCNISNNIIDTSGSRGIYFRGHYSRRVLVSGNNISNISRGPIATSGVTNELIIVNNFVDGSDNEGIRIASSDRCIIKGNTIRNIDTGGAMSITTSEYVTIEGNIMQNVINFGGIYLQSVDYGIIANNIIEDVAPYGMLVDANCSYLNFNGNFIRNCSTDGMRIEGSNHTIVGNTVLDITSTGIRIEADDCIVSSNNANGESIMLNGARVTSGLNKS